MSQRRSNSSSPALTPKVHRDPIEDIRKGFELMPGGYTQQDLADLVVDTAKKAAIEARLDEVDRDNLYFLQSTTGENVSEVEALLYMVFPIFDEAFFHGTRDTYFPSWADGNLSVRSRPAFIRFGKDTSGGYWSPIDKVLYICLDQGDQISPSSLSQAYLASLVHEMLHIFLLEFACKCEDESCLTTAGSGHGFSWAAAMKAIEQALIRELSWDIDGYCQIAQSLHEEILGGQNTLLSNDQLKELGLPPIHHTKRIAVETWFANGRPGETWEAGT